MVVPAEHALVTFRVPGEPALTVVNRDLDQSITSGDLIDFGEELVPDSALTAGSQIYVVLNTTEQTFRARLNIDVAPLDEWWLRVDGSRGNEACPSRQPVGDLAEVFS